MLKDQAEKIDTVGNNQDSSDEEQYQRLFKKMARDFVYIDDLTNILATFWERMLLADQGVSSEDARKHATGAILKAIEYRKNLSLPKHKRKTYKDVTDD